MPTNEERLLGWLALLRLPRQRAVSRRQLVERFGEPGLWLGPQSPDGPALRALEPLRQLIGALDWHAIALDLEWLQCSGAHLITWNDPHYPALLREIADPPVALFCQGVLPIEKPMVAVVGSRRATHAGMETAAGFAGQLSVAGIVVVSGLALGVDAAAHRGSLAAGGPTVAVLGSGLDLPYPRQNARPLGQIAECGAVLSEYPPTTRPAAYNFPYRNRIISGLSLGVLVIEAAQRSGSLITARLAGEQGRDVFAVPGAIGNVMSRGCHQLIRDGALLVESADDVLRELGREWLTSVHTCPVRAGASGGARAVTSEPLRVAQRGGNTSRGAPSMDGSGPPEAAEMVLSCVDFAPTSMDVVVERSGLTAELVSSMLLALELEGRVRAELGGRYVRAPDSASGPKARTATTR